MFRLWHGATPHLVVASAEPAKQASAAFKASRLWDSCTPPRPPALWPTRARRVAAQVLTKCSFRFMFPSPLPRRVRRMFLDGLLFAPTTQYHRLLK